jgi:hypothetical protein
MSAPLTTLQRVVDRWATNIGETGASDTTSQMFCRLERLFPKRWEDVYVPHLPADVSPIQLSLDTARPAEFRMVIELSGLVTNERNAFAVLADVLPSDQAPMLERLGHLVGAHIPRFGVGLRLRGGEVACKGYIGSDSPADFAPWIRAFMENKLIPGDRDHGALRLCKHIAKSSMMRGCSFTAGTNGTPVINAMYYLSLIPYRRASAIEIFRLVDVASGPPTVSSVADALGFSDGAGQGCFGHTVSIRSDGSVDNLKVEFSRIPREVHHELTLEALQDLGVDNLGSIAMLRKTIEAACGLDETLRPEVVSWRGSANGSASIVTYFALPRRDGAN